MTLSSDFHPGGFPLGTTTVTYTATDAVEHITRRSFNVTVVSNSAAQVAIVGLAPGTLVAVGSPVAFTGSFSGNPGDVHTVQWMLDSEAVSGTVNESTASASGTYAFSAPGVYLVQLAVADGSGSRATVAQVGDLDETVVVFDATGPFIAGGGRIVSPPGALMTSPGGAGEAGFGFVSKTRGAAGLTGEAEFYFQLGDFRFHASSYDVLTIGRGTALYRGQGTINGAGSYGFALSAVSGQVTGDGVGRLRLRITDGAGGVVYDNEPGAADAAPATTAVADGDITIVDGRLAWTTRSAGAAGELAGNPAHEIPTAYALSQNFPNPFAGSTAVRFDLPEPSVVRIAVYDLLGRQVASLAQGELPAGRHMRMWSTRGVAGGPVQAGVYVLRMEAAPLAGGRTFATNRKLVLLP